MQDGEEEATRNKLKVLKENLKYTHTPPRKSQRFLIGPLTLELITSYPVQLLFQWVFLQNIVLWIGAAR